MQSQNDLIASSAERPLADVASMRLGLPKGRMQAGVLRLLADAGIA
jgi:hypothetical protein